MLHIQWIINLSKEGSFSVLYLVNPGILAETATWDPSRQEFYFFNNS